MEVERSLADLAEPTSGAKLARSVDRRRHWGPVGALTWFHAGVRSSSVGSFARLEEALAEEWTIGRESVVLDEAGGSIAFRFHARDAHLVLSSEAGNPIPFRVLLDCEAPGRSHGVDDADGSGLLRQGRLYQLIREHDAVRDRDLEITFLSAGVEAYAFTFG